MKSKAAEIHLVSVRLNWSQVYSFQLPSKQQSLSIQENFEKKKIN